MRSALLLICAGIACATFASSVGRALVFFQCLILLLLFVLLYIERSKADDTLRLVVISSLCFSFGACWHLHWANTRLQERLPESLEGKTFQVVGIVTGLPDRSLIAQQFQFVILDSASNFYPRKIVLNYYGNTTILPGQYWRFSVRLNRPRGFSNPGGFDYEAWLFQQGVSARGYVRDSPANELQSTAEASSFLSLIVQLHKSRYSLRTRLQGLLGESRYSGLLIALLLGDRSAISQDNWRLFTATGSNHLFVISGLHIGMASGVGYWLMLVIGRLLGISRLMPVQKLATMFALGVALIYALLAGFTLPTQRAFIMIAVLSIGLFWNVRYLISLRLLLAALFVLMLNPLALSGSGFWLSFVAVSALLSFAASGSPPAATGQLVFSFRDRLRLVVSAFVRPQYIVFLALIVPLIYFTQQLSLLAPLVNLLAIPVVGFLIVPLSFLAMLASFMIPVVASLLFSVAHELLSILLILMQFLVEEGTGALQLEIPQPNLANLVFLCFAIVLLLLPNGICRKSLALPLLLSILPIPERIRLVKSEQDVLRLHVADVGQGLAVIVQTSDHALLYDAGANLGPDFNLGSAVVVPALRALDISSLSAVVISHGDNDHAGGLRGIEDNVAIEKLISSTSDLETNLSVELCSASNDWNWDGVEFRFLSSGLHSESENNNSCVLQIRSSLGSILLPGDIERETELRLARNYGAELASSVLLAPHHGSLSSSSYAFIKQVAPTHVIYSAGYRNSFGHPHERVVGRYDEFAVMAFETASSGMISIQFGKEKQQPAAQGVHITEHRKQKLRYWH